MYEFHGDRKRYFDIQTQNAEEYVIPFIEQQFPIREGMYVLEIGSAEGGVLKAFINRGCKGVGVELNAQRVKLAEDFLQDDIRSGNIRFISKDIYDANPEIDFGGKFDIIILKDVIEHIYNQERLIAWMKTFLKENGIIFFGFPPWYMPFGGHQQMCRSAISKLPYIHLLPRPIYKWILTKNNEKVDEFMEIVDTQITIERFERIVKNTGYYITHKKFYLINPIYQYKFGWKPREQANWLGRIPILRNFVTTCVYYCISPR